jgi:hypothetical protein
MLPTCLLGSRPTFRSPQLEDGKRVEVALESDGSGAGRGGAEKPDLLPPLMPGLAPRKQQ